VANWKRENIMLLKVLLPAIKAPMAPMTAAKAVHPFPTKNAAALAKTTGILSNPPETPLLMKTLTMGTANPRAMAGPSRVLKERFIDLLACFFEILWMKKLRATTTINKNPGR